MKQSIVDYKDVLIVGNGFDLNLGLKTSYSDYLGSDEFDGLLGNNNLAKHLKRCSKISKWVDIEKELYNYSIHLYYRTGDKLNPDPNPNKRGMIEMLKTEYYDVCSSLRLYLKKATACEIKLGNKASFRIISQVFKSKDYTYILTFNYTDIIERIHNYFFSLSKKNYLINHIHGSLSDENIVFGIEDSVEVAKEHVFLYKSHNTNQRINGLFSIFDNADNFTFFCYSLGETDHSYFDDFFKSQTMPDCKKKNFTFYHYGAEAYDDLIWQLKKLTNNRLSYLKQYNNLEFIDVMNWEKY